MRTRLCCLLLGLLLLALPALAGAETELLAINVGKADCLLLRSGEETYLIDTGTAESWGQISAALRVRGITRLTGVLITHTDSDHAGGAQALASSQIEVGAWYAPEFFTGFKRKKHPAVKAAKLRDQEVTWLSAGDTLPLGDGSLTVLGPLEEDGEKENNNSLVLLAETSDGRMLLTGDMEFPEEETLLEAGLDLHADVLKVANHGESDATSDDFALAVSPRAALISTDSAEEKDTPAVRVISALRKAGAEVFVTQDARTGILAVLDGGELRTEAVADEWPAAVYTVEISDKSVAQDMVCIRNKGDEAADLSGWYIESSRGSEIFVFPEGTVVQPGQELTVSALDSEDAGDLVWQDEEIWHRTKSDTALLFDAYGRLISSLE